MRIIRVSAAVLLLAAGVSVSPWINGCLSDPQIPTCADFPLGTEGCGSGCTVYCETVLQLCPGTFADLNICLDQCGLEPVGGPIPDGTFEEETGNTLSCRITQAKAGQCGEASLLNTQACNGVDCSSYCATMLSSCPTAYPSEDNCLASCQALPPGLVRPDQIRVNENTMACRQLAAEGAALEPSRQNCAAASFSGGGICGNDQCALYCDLAAVNCVGDNAIYQDRATCLDTCALMQINGNFDDWQFTSEIDTLQCRLYHVGPPAAAIPDLHCPHGGVYNDMHCGIDPDPALAQQPLGWPCATFCDITNRNCPGLYSSMSECRVECEAFSEVADLQPGEAPAIYPVTSTVCPTR